MKLTLELVPDTLTLHSLHRFLTTKAWNTLRKKALEESTYQCAICGASGGQLNCHEQWKYDDETHTQRLARLIMLCQMCHLVKHMNSGYMPFEELVQHFMKWRVYITSRARGQSETKISMEGWLYCGCWFKEASLAYRLAGYCNLVPNTTKRGTHLQ